MKAFLIASACVLLAAGCGAARYSDTASSALGRVVVYRNGIAYFERRAEVADNRLTLRVPQDKVDDFLRSLTVVDEQTGQQLPLSFPTQSATEDGMVNMVIELPTTPARSHVLRLSYITESPAWKPSYRLVVNDDGHVEVQGWAIVDNASGEDWNQVHLAVGASSALSFRFDLRTIRNVHRETLALNESFARPPPTGTGAVREQRAEEEQTMARFAQAQLSAAGQEAAFVPAESPMAAGQAGMPAPRPAAPPPPPQVVALAERLRSSRANVVINSYRTADDRDAEWEARRSANNLRNQLIEQGVAPEQLQVAVTDTPDASVAGSVEVAAAETSEETAAPDQHAVGESHFESSATMTVPRATSAMVSVLRENADGAIVYYYDPDAERGDANFAYRAVRFRNPTSFTLEAGPATVYGRERFIGEGLTESIPPGAFAFIPFALDRQVRVERAQQQRDEIERILTIDRGLVTADVRHIRTTTFKVRNRLTTAAKVFLRHTVLPGWNLRHPPESSERVGDDYIIVVSLEPGQSREMTIELETPLERTIDVRADATRQLLRTFLARTDVNVQARDALREVLALQDQIGARVQEIATRQRQIAELRARSEELHTQILTLEAVRARDTTLLRQLRDRMTEINARLQQATLDVVDVEQNLLVLRIRFQDSLATLTFEEPAAPGAAAVAAQRAG